METKRYYNAAENRWYNFGRGLTRRIDESTIFSGVPTEAQLKEWGYEEYIPPVVEYNEDDLEVALDEQLEDVPVQEEDDEEFEEPVLDEAE